MASINNFFVHSLECYSTYAKLHNKQRNISIMRITVQTSHPYDNSQRSHCQELNFEHHLPKKMRFVQLRDSAESSVASWRIRYTNTSGASGCSIQHIVEVYEARCSVATSTVHQQYGTLIVESKPPQFIRNAHLLANDPQLIQNPYDSFLHFNR